MSHTLNVVDHLLSRGRNFQRIGRDRDALANLNRLASFRDLPADVHEETLARIAEILIAEGRFTKARRHLTALLVQCPDNARYQYLMASAYDQDERADPHRAAEHYRKSLELYPKQVRCLGEFGLLALRLGQPEEGLKCLRQAVELAPHDVEAMSRLVEGLRQEGLDDEARDALLAARFRNGRDSRFVKLWNDFQFRILHGEQRRRAAHIRQIAEGRRPHILPFVRVVNDPERGEQVVRLDAPTLPQPPHKPQGGRVRGKKHA
jgi:tetratricopeptide (TPR) repeat protein